MNEPSLELRFSRRKFVVTILLLALVVLVIVSPKSIAGAALFALSVAFLVVAAISWKVRGWEYLSAGVGGLLVASTVIIEADRLTEDARTSILGIGIGLMLVASILGWRSQRAGVDSSHSARDR